MFGWLFGLCCKSEDEDNDQINHSESMPIIANTANIKPKSVAKSTTSTPLQNNQSTRQHLERAHSDPPSISKPIKINQRSISSQSYWTDRGNVLQDRQDEFTLSAGRESANNIFAFINSPDSLEGLPAMFSQSGDNNDKHGKSLPIASTLLTESRLSDNKKSVGFKDTTKKYELGSYTQPIPLNSHGSHAYCESLLKQ